MSSSSSGAFPQAFLPGLGHAVEHQTAQNIEDFEAQMAAARTLLPADDEVDHAPPPAYSRTASNNNAGGGNSSNGGRASSLPPPPPPSSSLFSSNAQGNNNNPPGLQAGRAWSSESVATFNNLCLKNAVANAFDYEQCRPMPPGWAVRLKFSFFGGTVSAAGGGGDDGENSFEIRLPGPYGSKKEAKAAAAERGLGVLREAIERRGKMGAGGKRKKSAAVGSEDGEIREGREGEEGEGEGEGESEGEEEVAENWVGLLGEYCQAENKPRPLFQEFILGANYSMECIMPSEEGRSPDEPFGGRNVLFNSKKTAKTNAAREAVRWLRQTGRMPKTGHPTKKKMKAAQQAMAAAANNASAFASASAPFSSASASGGMSGPLPTPVPIGGGGGGGGTASGSESDGGGNSSSSSAGGPPGFKDRSLGEQVMILCKTLGCAQPIYKITPDPRVPSMWSGAAYFPHDPAVAAGVVGQSSTAVGEVRNVYGKKKAREEVAKKVLKHLKGMQAERQKVVDGVLGAGAGAAGSGPK